MRFRRRLRAEPRLSSGWCSRRTTRASRSPATGSGWRPPSGAAPNWSSSRAGMITGPSLTCSRRASAASTAMSSSRRTRCRSATGEPWLGPDILDELDRLATNGVRRVLVCPVGFVSDHLEILWDLDIEARERAGELGLELDRIECLNDEPAFVDALVGVVQKALRVPSQA